MYSYEDRIRAVKLYIKLGKRLRATICQLGYPTKNSLIGWYREYERSQELRVGYSRSGQKYSDQQKQAAVKHYLDHDRYIASTMRALGYPGRALLTEWIDELHPEVRHRMVARSPNTLHSDALQSAAVIELCTRKTSAQEIAQKLAVCRPTLYNWKNQLLGREVPASMKRPNDSPPVPDTAELQRQVELLQQSIHRLQLEYDILKKVNELLKKGLGVNPQLLSNREKTLLVDALKPIYSLTELLGELGLARSSYFYHCARQRRPDKYADARVAAADVFQSNHRSYGYRRMRAALGRRQVHMSEKVVLRLMKQEGLNVPARKKRRYGYYLGEISLAPDNLLNRDFQAATPNEKWLTDITEFQIPAGKVYLSPVIDCFDGMVVSWTLGTRPDSDRGAHYRWPGWLARMHSAKLTRSMSMSMSRKGCSPDNAACEGFFGRLKNEMFYPQDWKSTTIEVFIRAVHKYIVWYNEKRIKISLGFLSPIEYRESLGLVN
ncbi:IS3 family transposase [Hydrogenophaga sp. ZJX-1]|uniref:IS3 family transposase n=1 Tax=Hydrogenophaga sp. ZJX-1 TaxID=3404778 RepID=UPI003B28D525